MDTTLKALINAGWKIDLNNSVVYMLSCFRGNQRTACIGYFRETLVWKYHIFPYPYDYSKSVVGEGLTLDMARDRAIAALSDLI